MRFLVEFTLCNLKSLSQNLREISLKLSKWQILKIDLVQLLDQKFKIVKVDFSLISIFDCQIGG